MEHTITIEGKDIRFRADGNLGRLYRFYFRKDLFKDFGKLQKSVEVFLLAKEAGEATDDDIWRYVEFELLENLAWAMAKKADPNLVDIDEWFSQFEKLVSVYEKIDEIMQMFLDSLATTVPPKNGIAEGRHP